MVSWRNSIALGVATLLCVGTGGPGTAWAAEGDLSFVSCLEDTGATSTCPSTGGINGLDGAAGSAISPDGKHVYVAGFFDNAIAAFSRDPASGALSFTEVEIDGVNDPGDVGGTVDGMIGATGVAVAPGGEHVYVTSQTDNSVVVFSRDANDGRLSFVEFKKDGVAGVDGIAGATSVSISPDEEHVYVVGPGDHAVAAFSRDETTGALTFVEFEQDGVNDGSDPGGVVDGLAAAQDVAVSHGGQHVYIAGRLDGAIAFLSRDANTGRLSFAGCLEDAGAPSGCPNTGGVDGISGANGIAVSPDDRHVYVTGGFDDAIATFSRDAGTGVLTFVGLEEDGVGGVENFFFATSPIVSPDGKQVYVLGSNDQALLAFSRNPSTGDLTFIEDEVDNVDDPSDAAGAVDGLNGPFEVVASPEGKSVYVTGSGEDAIALFARERDLTPPDTIGLTGPSGTTDDNTPTFAFSSDDALFTAGFECSLDAAAFSPCTSPQTTNPLADGAHRFQVRAIDTAKNADPTPAEANFIIDTTPDSPPANPPVTPPNDPVDTTAPETTIAKAAKKTKDRTPTFAFTSSEAGSTFACRIDGAAFSPCHSPLTTKRLKLGKHELAVRATDAAGNSDQTPATTKFKVKKKKKRR